MMLPIFGVFHVMQLVLFSHFFMNLSSPIFINPQHLCGFTVFKLPSPEYHTPFPEEVGEGCSLNAERCCLNQIFKKV